MGNCILDNDSGDDDAFNDNDIDDNDCSPGNASTELGKDLSMDLWENFVSGMSAGYPSIAEYDANVDVRYSLSARWLQII